MAEVTLAILAIGNELLNGDVANTNTQWLARRFRTHGAELVHASIVRDRDEEIGRELEHALSYRPHVIVTTGGLGPTEDDRTVGAVAHALDLALEENPSALAMVDHFYRSMALSGRVASAERTAPRRKMARLPKGARPIANSVGAAPGVWVPGPPTHYLLLPGVPEEMESIMEVAVRTELADLLAGGGYSETERFAHISDESALAPLLREVADRHPQAYVKSRAEKLGRSPYFRITLSARGPSTAEADARVRAAATDLRATLERSGIALVDRRPEDLSADGGMPSSDGRRPSVDGGPKSRR